jgi:hypothetical protein
MKKLLFVFSMIIASAVAANAQDSTATQGAGSTMEKEYSDKESIAVTELPSIIQDQLKSQDYSSWTVSNAYRKEKEGKTVYAVEMTSGSETKVVKFDAQGNKLKEKDKDHSEK